mmetsp:Transcript_36015/g.82184  ORF Transcript_36015/g.82184 Transcript_36015/m.82184 type:complete len:111 (-) Transcript_36015:795-1127(-)
MWYEMTDDITPSILPAMISLGWCQLSTRRDVAHQNESSSGEAAERTMIFPLHVDAVFFHRPRRPTKNNASAVIPQNDREEWPLGKDILASISHSGPLVHDNVNLSNPHMS